MTHSIAEGLMEVAGRMKEKGLMEVEGLMEEIVLEVKAPQRWRITGTFHSPLAMAATLHDVH